MLYRQKTTILFRHSIIFALSVLLVMGCNVDDADTPPGEDETLLEVTVVNDHDQPFEGAKVAVDDDGEILHQEDTDANGKVAFDDLDAGDYRVEADADNHDPVSEEVTVSYGEVTTLRLGFYMGYEENEPTITTSPTEEATVGVGYSYDVEITGSPLPEVIATGSDGDDLPHWLSFDDEALELTGTPSTDDVGAHDVEIVASNELGSDQQTFSIDVDE